MANTSFSLFQISQIVLSTFSVLVGLRLLAPRLGLVDKPNLRKRHVGTIPVVGGIGLLMGATLAIYARGYVSSESAWFVGFATTIVAIGVVDDRFDMKAGVKLSLQILATTIFLITNPGSQLRVHEFDAPLWISTLLHILFLTGSINAFNMLDGSDGLAGGVAAVVLAALTLASHFSGAPFSSLICTAFLSAVMAFLSMNAQTPWQPRATIFLGDAGSMLLGLVISFALLDLTRASARWQLSHVAFFLAFPIIETISLFARRINLRRNPFSADRLHMHHLLIDAGWSASATALAIATVNGGMALLGAALHEAAASMFFSGILFSALFVAHSIVVRQLTQSAYEPSEFVAKSERSDN